MRLHPLTLLGSGCATFSKTAVAGVSGLLARIVAERGIESTKMIAWVAARQRRTGAATRAVQISSRSVTGFSQALLAAVSWPTEESVAA